MSCTGFYTSTGLLQNHYFTPNDEIPGTDNNIITSAYHTGNITAQVKPKDYTDHRVHLQDLPL